MLRAAMPDHVDRIVAQWRQERPDLDTSGNAVMARLLRAARALERCMASVFERYGLNRGEFDVLASLRRAGAPFALGPTRLSEGLLLSTAAMTNRVDNLERMGLVRRRPDPCDRRQVQVELTQRGRTLIDEAFPALIAEEERLLLALSAGEREALTSLLRTVLTAWERAGLC
jgi:DNA-binding MarR family transcriptional regulator